MKQYSELTPEEKLAIQEYEALIGDYNDWVERHDGNYSGDYWD